jgi:hypothetical protein
MKITIPAFTQLFAIMLVGILSGCSRGPMPPNKESADKVADRIQEAGKNVTEKEVEDGKASDEGKKALMHKMLVEPFENAGYDLNATLEDFAVRLRDKSFTQDEGEVMMLVMSIYGEQAEDLAHFGFISEQTLKDLDKVYKNSKVRDAEAAAQKKLDDAKVIAATANAQAEAVVARAEAALVQATTNSQNVTEAAKVLEDAKTQQAETAKALQVATDQAAANAAR